VEERLGDSSTEDSKKSVAAALPALMGLNREAVRAPPGSERGKGSLERER